MWFLSVLIWKDNNNNDTTNKNNSSVTNSFGDRGDLSIFLRWHLFDGQSGLSRKAVVVVAFVVGGWTRWWKGHEPRQTATYIPRYVDRVGTTHSTLHCECFFGGWSCRRHLNGFDLRNTWWYINTVVGGTYSILLLLVKKTPLKNSVLWLMGVDRLENPL